jgi:hypothetical protein
MTAGSTIKRFLLLSSVLGTVALGGCAPNSLRRFNAADTGTVLGTSAIVIARVRVTDRTNGRVLHMPPHIEFKGPYYNPNSFDPVYEELGMQMWGNNVGRRSWTEIDGAEVFDKFALLAGAPGEYRFLSVMFTIQSTTQSWGGQSFGLHRRFNVAAGMACYLGVIDIELVQQGQTVLANIAFRQDGLSTDLGRVEKEQPQVYSLIKDKVRPIVWEPY